MIESTTASVQSLPGEYHVNPFTKLVIPMIIAPITAPTKLDPAKNYGGKRDQGKAKRMIPSHGREVKTVEFPASARKRAGKEEPKRDGTGDIDAHELGADGILTNSPN